MSGLTTGCSGRCSARRLNPTVGHEFGDTAHAVKDSEMVEEGLDFWLAHFFGVAFVVEWNVAFDPVIVSLFGAVGVMLGARDVTGLIEKFFR